jgi:signal transduction histidine kinase
MGPEQREIFNAYWTIALFLGAVISFFLFHMFKKQKELRVLQQEKLDAEIRAVEQERNNIATELHNEIGPILSGVKMRLNLIDTPNTADAENLKRCSTALDQMVLQIRSMAKQLAPLGMLRLSYREALMQYIEKTTPGSTLKIEYSDQVHQPLPEEMNNQVYRVLQEIIQNTVKHAKAMRLSIEVTIDRDQLLIRTSDDGIGFRIDELRANNQLGMGLLNIQSRIGFLRGTISSPTRAKIGTQYNIRIPLTA